MERKEKQGSLPATRADVRQIVGVFEERINDKFKLITEALDNIFKKLDEHTQLFKDMGVTMGTKVDVKEFDSLERRVTKIERKEVRPSRSG